MLVTWKYRPRNTIIQRLDPRARLIMLAATVVAFTQLWDLRVLVPLTGFALALYLLARIEWSDVRRVWLFILVFITIIVIVNTILGARGGPAAVRNDTSVPLISFGWVQITETRLWFLVAQALRMVGGSLMAIPIPFTFAPTQYGVAFRQFGVPDKPAYSIDLAFRLVPTLGRDFGATMDAQRARGFELDRLRGGLFERLRRLAPLVVPVVVHAIVGGEEIVDAMDLRAFGTSPRTWSGRLTYAARDIVYIGLALVIGVGAIVLANLGAAELWYPRF
jgi:energy-coupling factor transport system permease protein